LRTYKQFQFTDGQGVALKKIEWGEQFSVGVAILDDQHKQLIGMINCLIDNQEARVDSEPVADVLQTMTQYAAYHFKTEERLMEKFDYPQYASHQTAHTEFKAKTARFCMDAIAHKNALAGEVLTYLSAWLTHHILESDMKYKAFFAARMDNGLAKYNVYASCIACGELHPMNVSVAVENGPKTKHSVGQTYQGKELSPQLAELRERQIYCPKTGRQYPQKNDKQIFLIPVSAVGSECSETS
jgi:hemerythrin-like metal-binding protein